jgi:hypothetical protein
MTHDKQRRINKEINEEKKKTEGMKVRTKQATAEAIRFGFLV